MLKSKNTGFTLLELMIAMIIFSFMSIMAYTGLINVFKSDKVISTLEHDLRSLRRTMMFIDRDMRQLTLRPRKFGFTNTDTIAPLSSNLDGEGLIEFTSAGVSNPLDLVRSSLQRVRYTLDDNQLKRLSWKLVDHFDAEPSTMSLLDNVESLTFKFLSKTGTWEENWGATRELPRAVELTLTHKKWGEIKRLIPIK